MDSNYCVCINQYLRQLENLAQTLMGLNQSTNISTATDSGFTNPNTLNTTTNSSGLGNFFADNSLMIFCILLLGLIYFMGNFTGRSSQRDLNIGGSSMSDENNEKINN